MVVKIAIVGRPNVGKSTLFNRLTGRRLALVHEKPGLTRDRREADARIGSTKVQLVDTAGLEDPAKGTIEERMRGQTQTALADADILLFLIDARAGLVPADEIFAEMARSSGKPVVLAANKCEGRATQSGLYEGYSLGLGDPIALSAEHNQGLDELVRALEAAIAELSNGRDAEDADEDAEADADERPMRVAIVGRPNAGKSTLVNAIIGEERLITGPEAGITRDSIAVELSWKGQDIRLFDTAGLRRKAKVKAGGGAFVRWRCAARHPVCGSCRVARRCAGALRETGLANRGPRGAGRACAGHRRQQVGPGARQERKTQRFAARD